MKWTPIKRNDAGLLEQSTADNLLNIECSRVVFWNDNEGVAEIIQSDMLLVVDRNKCYTHYMKIESPKLALQNNA